MAGPNPAQPAHSSQSRPQHGAALSEDISVPGGGSWYRRSPGCLFRGKCLKACGRHGARDAEVDEEVVVAPDAIQGVPDDEERPPLPDDFQCPGDRARSA